MKTEQDEINSLTALIAEETAAAHEALRLELDNFDELSLSEEDSAEEDECRNEQPNDNTRESTPPPIGLRNKENVEHSLRLLRGHLSDLEIGFIVDCPQDEDGGVTLQRCMILNRSKRMELLQSYQHYSNLMWKITCDEKNASSVSSGGFNQWLINKVSAPYFKVDKGFSHGLNSDVLQMRANGELSVYFVSAGRRRWTLENQTNLRGAIRLSYYDNKRAKLERDLRYLKSKVSRCQNEEQVNDYNDQIGNFENELRVNEANYENHFPPLDSEEFIDWEDISLKDLQGKFSPATCKAMWRLYLHPEINNEDWNASEIERVHEIVCRNNYQRWELIATELGGNRSPYLLCVHFFSALVDRYDRHQFSLAESSRLKAITDKYLIRMGNNRQMNMLPGKSCGNSYIPWAKVARDFGSTRSRTQLYMHYMYRLRDRDNRIIGNFTASEDVQIMYMVSKYGENFSLIAEHMKRTSVQLRSHYLTYLKPLNTEQIRNWTLEDDERLAELVKLFGNRFAMISRELDRTVGSVRGRFKIIQRYMEIGTEIKNIPRRKRGHQQVIKRAQSKILAEALADTKEPLNIDYIRQTFNEKPIKLPGLTKLGRPSLKYDVVDQQLISYFKASAGIGRTYKLRQISEENLERCAVSIRNIFSVLKLKNLDIPSSEELNEHATSFDDIDHSLLALLRNNLRNNDQDDDEMYLPPNISNISALKGLIILSKSIGGLKDAELRELFKNDLEDLSANAQEAVVHDRNIFVERLNNILMWPSVLSLQTIDGAALVESEPEEQTTPPNLVKKLKGRPKRDRARINMMLEARKKQRKKKMQDKLNSNYEGENNTSSSETVDSLPSTSQEKPHLKIAVKQKMILNKTVATSVEEVNKLLKAGKSMGPTKTLVKVDKKTIQKMQRDKNYVHNRMTRSRVKSITEDNEDTTDLNNEKTKIVRCKRKNKSMTDSYGDESDTEEFKTDISQERIKKKVRNKRKTKSMTESNEDKSDIEELQINNYQERDNRNTKYKRKNRSVEITDSNEDELDIANLHSDNSKKIIERHVKSKRKKILSTDCNETELEQLDVADLKNDISKLDSVLKTNATKRIKRYSRRISGSNRADSDVNDLQNDINMLDSILKIN